MKEEVWQGWSNDSNMAETTSRVSRRRREPTVYISGLPDGWQQEMTTLMMVCTALSLPDRLVAWLL